VASGGSRLTGYASVIVNPASAAGRTRRRWPGIARSLERALGGFEHHFTEVPGHAHELARAAAARGATLVVSVGGDGTAGEIVDGLLGSGLPLDSLPALGLVPSGTGRDLATSLAIPRDLEAAIAGIGRGIERRIDAGRVTFAGAGVAGGLRHFVNVAHFGLGGAVVERVNRGRHRLGGRWTFLLATILTQVTYDNPPMRLVFDDGDEIWQGTFREVVAANGPAMGGGMVIAPGARMDDGLLDIVAIGDIGAVATLALAPSIYRGRDVRDGTIRRRTARKLVASSPAEVLVGTDGERPGRLPAAFEILPGAVRIRG
jgi:YegS/Rv2252/BmrU family lipid kinase